MSKTVTSVVRCDNCGQVNTTTTEYSHELPNPLNATAFAINYVGTPNDYCHECVAAVQDATTHALAVRKAEMATRA